MPAQRRNSATVLREEPMRAKRDDLTATLLAGGAERDE
jgi:hypothetical protein